MILQALKEYYDRKAADPASGIAPLGWEWKEIPFLFVITETGDFVQIEDTREIVGKKKRAKFFLVPQSVGRTRNPVAFTLWDKAEYAFPGVACGTDANKKHSLFLENLDPYGELPSVLAVKRYLSGIFSAEHLKTDERWIEYVQSGTVATFKIAGHEQPVPCEESFVRAYNAHMSATSSVADGICLVTGQPSIIARTHHKIVGVAGTDKNRGSLVSFNWKAAESFGKEQSYNSPIGQEAEFAYTTALNTLLGKDSKQKMQVGDATTVFWSSRDSALEDEFADLFGEPEKDNPDKGVDAVERLLSSVKNGAFVHDEETTRFYVLGLSPNSARIAVRFWHEGTVAEMERRFADWFENLRIDHGPKDKEHLSLWRLLCSIAPLGKSENVPPNLAGAVMRSILEGTVYPATLLSSAIVRIKAERDVTYPRAKLIKAFINHNLNPERKLTVSLDKDNTNVGYRLGRLFAVLERIQCEAAKPAKLNATIRDRFYASASATPAAVFGNLMRLKNHHLAKLEKPRFFEDLIGEIVAGIQVFPPHLSLGEQGMFAIGYYHQRQDFFAGRKTKADGTNDATPTTGSADAVQTELSL